MSDDRFLTREEIAERLKVSTRTIDQLRENGMPACKLPGSRLVRFNLDAVSAWMQTYTPAAAAANE